MSQDATNQHLADPLGYETLNLRREGAVLFVEIAAPTMNLLETELIRDLVAITQRAQADGAVQVLVFTSADPEHFISHVDVTRIAEVRQEAAKLSGEPSILQRIGPAACRALSSIRGSSGP